jgi:putative nicotinate phosphoribosyltransferase
MQPANNSPFNRNISMLTDFYELTMAGGYLENGLEDEIGVFDMFFRAVPENGGFAIACGLEQLIEYITNLHFSDEDIDFLRSKNTFSENFLNWLANFKFTCNVWAVPEGTPVFAGEPLVIVEGPVMQAQMLETALLITINHQTLIATKASRVVRAAGGRPVVEFGARRAQGYDASVYGARAAYIAGCAGTSNVLADQKFGIPSSGTMGHSWVQMFATEYEAFTAYAKTYPNNCILLVDSYNTLKSGVPNAIRVFDEVLKPMGIRPKAIRIDSGDISYLSKRARTMLDEAGYNDVTIVASNSLDEYLILELLRQDAAVDSFGVGEKLITSRTAPVLGGVYKLVAVKENGTYIPKIKVSESVEKITVPHLKKVYRLYDNATGTAMADYVTMHDETDIPSATELTLFDPLQTWKRQTFTNFTLKPLLVPIFENGKLVYNSPTLNEIRAYHTQQLATLWDELKRFEYPHKYYVDLSDKLWQERQNLLETYSMG